MLPLVQISSFSWQYGQLLDNPMALDHVDLQIYSGERVGLVGRSGSGKSTLSLTLNGLIPSSCPGIATIDGMVVVDEILTTTTTVPRLAQIVGMVFQTPDMQLTQQFVRHEIALGPACQKLSRMEIEARVLEAAQLVGIEHLLARSTANLSGGEKQKVVIASILAQKPKLLVLDEPTTDLDPKSKYDLIDFLSRLSNEITVLVISHDLEAILPCVHRLVVMDEGKIVADGSKESVLASDVLTKAGVAVPAHVRLNQIIRQQHSSWQLTSGIADLKPLFHPNGKKPNVTITPQNSETAVDFDHVSFAYPKMPPVVKDVSLKVLRGEMLAILGNNGAGKSTLLKLIVGLLKPKSGSVMVFGNKVTKIHPELVGYICQNPDEMLSQFSVKSQIEFTPRMLKRPLAPGKVAALLKQVGLEAEAETYPFDLSKGQRQKVAYTSVVAADPEIYIFDEPTTGIDHPSVEAIMAYMDQLRRAGKTIIFITHDIGLALEWADRLIIMHGGELVHEGKPESLIQTAQANLDLWGLRLPPLWELARDIHLNPPITPEHFLEAI